MVVGLEDTSGAYGAMNVYNAGTLTAKVGRLNSIGTVFGTVVPSGWGIYTENGYFSGVVAASQLLGGTVTGQAINGGTITGGRINGGTVSGGYVTGGTVSGALVIGGTVATSAPPINSSNTGVYLDSTGLYGYGSAGLTFRLSSDPAIKPYFSSGTIQEVVYEVTTNAVIRTGTSNPRIQIDNSGIFGWNSGGVQTLAFDLSSGQLNVVNGIFSGSVSASQITGGTVTGSRISGGTVVGGVVSGGTVSGAVFTGGTVSQGTISAAVISGGTITGSLLSGTVSQSGIIRATGTAFEPFGILPLAGTTELHGHGLTMRYNSGTTLRYAQGYGYYNENNNHKIYTNLYVTSGTSYLMSTTGDFGTVAGNLQLDFYAAKGSTGSYESGWFGMAYNAFALIPQYDGSSGRGVTIRNRYTNVNQLTPYNNNAGTIGGTVSSTKYGWKELWLASPDNTVWKITVSNAGALTVSAA